MKSLNGEEAFLKITFYTKDDGHNGYGLTFNWNLLGGGLHLYNPKAYD